MGLLADVGRSGAVPDLLNRLRQSRQDVAAGKLAEATEIRAQAGEERAAGRFETEQVTAGLTQEGLQQQRNLNALRLKEAEESRARDTKVRKFSDIEQADPFSAELMRNSGYVEVVNGEEIVTGKSAREFFDQFGGTPAYQKGQIRFKRQNAEDHAQALEQQLAQLKPTDKSRPEIEQQLQQVKETASTFHEMEVALFRKDEKLAQSFTGESLDKFDKSGKFADLVRIETPAEIKAKAASGKGRGLKAADESLINKMNRSIRGGTFDPRSGAFSALDPEKETEVSAANERASKLLASGKANTIGEAVAMANRELKFDIENIGERIKQVEAEPAPAPVAGGRQIKSGDKTLTQQGNFWVDDAGSKFTVKNRKLVPVK